LTVRNVRLSNLLTSFCVLCYYAKDRQKFIMCDEIAMALALDDSIATAVQIATCSVETRGWLTRGQMVITQPPFKSNATQVRLVTAIDFDRFVQLLIAGLTD